MMMSKRVGRGFKMFMGKIHYEEQFTDFEFWGHQNKPLFQFHFAPEFLEVPCRVRQPE